MPLKLRASQIQSIVLVETSCSMRDMELKMGRENTGKRRREDI